MIDANIYSEVYEILSYMDKSTVMKIPVEILKSIKNKRNVDYISQINPQDPFNKKNINSQTLVVLACLDINYWMDEEKRKELKSKYFIKIQNEELKKSKEYGEKLIFNRKSELNLQEKENMEFKDDLMIIYKESFWGKIYNKIKHIFKK